MLDSGTRIERKCWTSHPLFLSTLLPRDEGLDLHSLHPIYEHVMMPEQQSPNKAAARPSMFTCRTNMVYEDGHKDAAMLRTTGYLTLWRAECGLEWWQCV